jgi:hypothetical protein
MAQAQVGLFHWTVQLTAYCSLETVSGQRQHREEGRWQAPRQSDADAMRLAAARGGVPVPQRQRLHAQGSSPRRRASEVPVAMGLPG